MKTLSLLLATILLSTISFAQSGSIRGRVVDSITGETIPGANVWIVSGFNTIGAVTDANGYYHVKSVTPGVYTLNVSFVGYRKISANVRVSTDRITSLKDIALSSNADLPAFEIVWFPEVNLDPEISVLARKEELSELPNKRDFTAVIQKIVPGAQTSEDGKEVYLRGARNGSVVYYVDGVKQRSSNLGVPSSAISSMTVYMSGVPAKYGDFDGGVVVVETLSYFDLEAERQKGLR